MESFVCYLLASLIAASKAYSVCMADCTVELTQLPPSLYEQYCCIHSNSGKKFELKEGNNVYYILCSSKLPSSCQRFSTILNCSDLFRLNSSAISGYYISNGSFIYCNIEDYIDGYDCSEVFRRNQSAPSAYYKIPSNGTIMSVYCDIVEYINGLSLSNCSHIYNGYSSAPSGYYTIRAPNGSLISVYCDMEGSKCDGKGGWMRIGYLNMSEPGATCPPGLTQRQYNNIDHDVCGLPNSGVFSRTFFSTQGIHYNKVCSQLRGYQYGTPDAFNINSNNIDSCYVDGISITYGSNPRKHIWTYANGLSSVTIQLFSCPCNSGNTAAVIPNFVGNSYFCESGLPVGQQSQQQVLYSNDPLWDGKQCNADEGQCCTNPKMPWFIKTLNETTIEDIELRVCANEGYINEDTPLDVIEVYVS